jgi:hypothetical protein
VISGDGPALIRRPMRPGTRPTAVCAAIGVPRGPVR